MRKLIGLLVSALVLSVSAFANGSGSPVYLNYATTNVTATAYTQVLPSIPGGATSVTIANSGSYPIYVAVGSSANRQNQIIVPALMSLTAPLSLSLTAPYNTPISVESVGSTNSTGILQMNFLQN